MTAATKNVGRVQVVRCSRCRHAIAVLDEHSFVSWTRWGSAFRKAAAAPSRKKPPARPWLRLDLEADVSRVHTLEDLVQAHLLRNAKCAELGRVAVDACPRLTASKGAR